MSDSATPWTAARQASLSFTISWNLLKLIFIESVMLSTISSSVVPFFSCPQSFPASGSFPTSWLCLKWPKYWVITLNMFKSLTHHQWPIKPSLEGSALPWREENQDSQMNAQEIVNSTNIGSLHGSYMINKINKQIISFVRR